MKPRKTTYVLVSDASRARLYLAHHGAPWEVIDELEHAPGRQHTHTLLSDREGRVIQHGDPSHHAALTPHTDPRENEAVRFARTLSQRLTKALNAHAFDELILVSPPHFLGLLRAEIDENVRKCVRGTLAKDLAAFSGRTVRARLRGAGLHA